MNIKLLCLYCPYEASHWKDLIDHYEANHASTLKWYYIKHRPTGNSAITKAPSAQEACQINDWMIGDCIVIEIESVWIDPHGGS